jgi:hypothetical protein
LYEHGQMVKTHPRKAPGQRSIDKADFPEEALAAGQRDIDFFVRKARGQTASEGCAGGADSTGAARSARHSRCTA